ncbi:glycosyltransferase [Flavobacterium sp.]|uniref:glycosyltransferase family 2 protein n=1 Tax=Flavobacterium sp. TaxID=239 RepID=UPI0032664954
MHPLISVIIPCYMQAQYLDEALTSVFTQTYKNWECIIVNDGSSDDTHEIAEKWLEKDSRYKYIYQKNKGVSAARNNGIGNAKGEFILQLDADDKIDSTLIEKVILRFDSSNCPQLIYCDVTFFGVMKGIYQLPTYSYKRLLVQNCFVICSAFKKSDWIAVGGYDENLKSFEDWDFWIRILNPQSTVVKISEELYFYRKHEKGSLTNNFRIDNAFYNSLYDSIYNKNKKIYDAQFGNPILAFQENIELKAFNQKVKKLWIFKLYVKIKKVL